MYKQEALDSLECFRSNTAHILGDNDEKVKTIETCMMLVQEVEEASEWIPVSERLPEEDTDILVTYVHGKEVRVIPVNYGRGTWYDCIFDSALDSLKVTAWMPLPEPYKEGKA